MAVGLSAAMANEILNVYRGGGAGTTLTAPAVMAVKLHTADPGAAAATAASANTTRPAVTMGAAAAGVMALSNSPSWASWASGSETESHVSLWDATTAGTFKYSAVLTTAKAVVNGDTLTLTSLSVSLTPLAA